MDPKLHGAALELQSFSEAQGWEFAIIGGLAVQAWGRARTTTDVDATVMTYIANEIAR
jgi:hypothetical protein